jgi:hypothetical protein
MYKVGDRCALPPATTRMIPRCRRRAGEAAWILWGSIVLRKSTSLTWKSFRIDWYTRLTLTDVSLTIKNQSRLLVDESFYLANIFLRSWPLLLYTHI